MDKVLTYAKAARDFVNRYPLSTAVVAAVALGFVLGLLA